MKKYSFILLILLLNTAVVLGGNYGTKKGFVAFHYGRYGVLSGSFLKYYGSRYGKFYGGSFGVPVSKNIAVFLKASYFRKDGIPIYEPTGLREGSAVLKEGIVELGMQFKSYLTETVNFVFISGITIAAIDEERFSPGGQFTYETEGNGNFGIFIGGALEINIGNTPFSVVNELNYIYSWKPVLEYANTYQALNFTSGLRFYFGS